MSIVPITQEKIVLGVTTSVLFDMSEPDAVFREAGPSAYSAYMKELEDDLLQINPAFEYVKHFSQRPNHEVVLLSRNTPITAIRALKTLMHHGVVVSAFAFTNGNDPVRYLRAYDIDQFMTANQRDAEISIARGFAGCHIPNPRKVSLKNINFKVKRPVTIATNLTETSNVFVLGNHVPRHQYIVHQVFDIDGVFTNLNSENYYREHGLELYREFEKANFGKPLEKGPFFDWFTKTSKHPQSYLSSVCTIRGTMPAYRLLFDLYRKGIDINGELHATSGRDKFPVLKELQSSYGLQTIFYDDNPKYIEQAKKAGLIAGHVSHPQDPKPAA